MKSTIVAAFMAATWLVACGGGGGDSNAPPVGGSSSDVAVTVTGPGQPVPGGTTATFVATVKNNGPDAAANVALTSSATGTAAGAVAVTFTTCTAAGGATCPATVGAAMTVPSLPSGGQLTFQASGAVPSGTSGAIAVTLTAATASDAAPANNTATANASAYSDNVSVSVAAPTAAVPAGAEAAYTVTVANAGPDAARDVVVTATPSTGLTLGTVGCVGSGGATCPTTLGGVSTLALLPSGGQVVLSMPAMVTAGTNGPIRLDATVAAAGDPVTANNAANASATAYAANVSVSVAGEPFVAAGSTASFVGTISNAGPGDAENLLVTRSLTAGFTSGTVTCTAAGGAVCPASFAGPTTPIPVLPVGGTLALTIPVAVGSAQRGAIVSELAVAAPGDPVAANNTSSATTTARDARSGDYRMHVANGLAYTLSLDGDAGTYRVTGNGLDVSGTAPYDAPSGWFVVAANARFRTYEDVVIGGFDFGTGVLPFFAARRFLTDVAQLNGEFISFRSYTPVTGPKDSFINGVRLLNGLYQQCNDNTFYTVDACPAPSRASYPITWNGTNFLAEVSPGTQFSFRVAMSGTTPVVLRASGSNVFGWTFMVALPGATYTTGTFHGISSAGTAETTTLGAASYSATRVAGNGAVSADSSTLFSSIAAVPGLKLAMRASDSASIFIMSSGEFAAVVGARSGPLAGYVEVLGR